MKNAKVALIPLDPTDRDQFIWDNQWAFKRSAVRSRLSPP